MPRIMSADARSDDRSEHQQEEKLLELQKKYREMQNKHQQYGIETDRLLKKQRKEIEVLSKDKEEIMAKLSLSGSVSNVKKDDINTRQLSDIADNKSNVHTEIDEEEKMIKDLKQQLVTWQQKVTEINKQKGGMQMHSEWVRTVEKQVKVLENRLTQANSTFNCLMTENRRLREEIEDKKHERIKYEQIKQKRLRELTNLRREIAQAIETSTHCYEARDEAQAKLQLLKEKSEKDKMQHESEMKELCRELDHDRRLKEFMDTKCSERKEDATLAEWRRRKEDQELAKKREGPQETVEVYEEAFERLKEMLGEENLDLLVDRFNEKETQNFSDFNYVSELSNMIELHQEQINQIKADIEQFKKEEAQLEDERRQILTGLEERALTLKKNLTECELADRKILKVLDQLKGGVEGLLSRIECDRTAMEKALGSSEGITVDNLLQYLGLVEHRTNELLHLETFTKLADAQQTGKPLAVPPLAIGQDAKSALAPPLPPSLQDDAPPFDDDDALANDEDHPFTREELLNKVAKSVEKRERDTVAKGLKEGTNMTITMPGLQRDRTRAGKK